MTKRATLAVALSFPINPVPAGRPRVGRWGTYYPKTYKNWLTGVADFVDRGELNLSADQPVLVVVEQIVKKPKTTKKLWPRGDCDNYVKGPLDVLTKTGGYWVDDDQITYLFTSKRFTRDGEEPRTDMEIYLL